MNKKELYESIMELVSIEVKKAINESLTPIDKMDLWHEGKRKQNVKSCSDDKLQAYYKICCDKGYILEANKLRSEIILRDNEISPMIFKTSFTLTPLMVCQYIEEHTSDIGDMGCDLNKVRKSNGCVYYSWGSDGHTIVNDHDCKVDFSNNTVEIYGQVISLNDPIKVINTINLQIFEDNIDDMDDNDSANILNDITAALRFEINDIAKANGCSNLKLFGKLWEDEKEDLFNSSWEEFLETLNGGDCVDEMIAEAIDAAFEAGVIEKLYGDVESYDTCCENEDVMDKFCKEIYKEMF